MAEARQLRFFAGAARRLQLLAEERAFSLTAGGATRAADWAEPLTAEDIVALADLVVDDEGDVEEQVGAGSEAAPSEAACSRRVTYLLLERVQ